jgi:amidohydrolase
MAPRSPAASDMPGHIARIIARIVAGHRDEILDISHRIHADPEVAFQEEHSAALVADVIERHGYTVERGVGGLPTAMRGTLVGGLGPDGPTIGVLAEYDALPGLGHGCGHNTMAASGVGAAIALAEVAPRFRGRIVFLGTPAEELGSGKEILLQAGVFQGIDAALLFHPSDRTHTRVILLASEDVDVTFTGLQSHASSDPWLGRNALDAMIALFTSIGLWRQQLRPDARVHGIITDGGTAANMIPARTAGRFMIRARDQQSYDSMRARFEDLVRAAALAAGCVGSVVFSGRSTVMRNNEVLARLWSANLSAAGVADGEPVADLSGSSDMGNVSLVLPAIHPCLAICEEGVAGHSIEFRDAAAMPRADEVTLLAATLVAQTAWQLLEDPSLLVAAWQEHRSG